jgi:hypothetical protein
MVDNNHNPQQKTKIQPVAKDKETNPTQQIYPTRQRNNHRFSRFVQQVPENFDSGP